MDLPQAKNYYWSLTNLVTEFFTGGELRNLLGSDMNLLTSCGITTRAGFTFRNTKASEANQGDFISLSDSLHYSIREGFNHCFAVPQI